MAVTRKALSAMGIEADKIDQIIEMHSETVTALKEQIGELNDQLADKQKEADENKKVQKELDELKKQVEADAKSREGKDYDALKKEYDEYKAEQEQKAVKATKEKALREFLKDMKLNDRGIGMVVKYKGIDSVELDEDGKIKDAAELRKEIKEDWGDYITSTQTKGAEVTNPPANNGGKTTTKAEIMKIRDSKERQKAIAENPDLFGLSSN